MGYDVASQMTGIGRYSDLDGTQEIASSTSTYDDAGRLTNLTHNSNGEVLSAYDWAYDKANRITQAVSPDGVSDYNYDQTDQLVDADHDYQESENYVYDNNGNRVNDGYVTGENNQLLSDGTYDYEYDAEGNRVKKTEIATGEVTEYEWDYRNKLVAVETEDSAGNVIANSEYTYDVFDRRIAKSVDADGEGAGVAEVERYVHDGDHIALTFDGFGNQIERFLHGTGIDQVLAQENAGGKVLWALADNQGSVRMVLDSEGNVVNEITYDAFGNITVESNPDLNFRFSYTGRELDEETGLYNYRSRYYDPAVGQFINEDTIGFAGGDSNLYRYVANSPVNYIDPFGYRTTARTNTYRNNRVWNKPNTGSTGGGQLGSPGYYNPGSFGNTPATGYPTERGLLPNPNLSDFWRRFWNRELPWQTPDPIELPKPYVTPTCVTVPGSTCTPQEENDFFDSDSDWFERMRELIEEQNQENDQRNDDNNSDSCGPGDRPDYLDPQASNENSDNDGQPEGDSDRGDGDADETQQNENDLVFRVPDSRRHRISKVKQGGVKKEKNTVVPDSVDFNADISAINEGRAIKNQDDTFTVNGRTYGYHPETGKTYPISGKDFYELDRGAYEALGIYNKFGNTSRANDILDNIGIDEVSRQSALEAQNANQ